MRLFFVLLAMSLLTPVDARAADPLVFHAPDSGAPPFIFVTPGASAPTGIVVEVVEEAARRAGRTVKYNGVPRESLGAATAAGGGSLFFSTTRAAPPGARISEAVLRMDSVLVTPKDRTIGYERTAQLGDKRLCTLTDETYPPLALLDMSGKLFQRKAKTEQAQLLMLRNEDCVAAVINGPMYRWLAARYHWDDLRIEPQPLLSENLVLAFGGVDASFADQASATVRGMRASGELQRIVQRYLPGAGNLSAR